MSNINYSHFDYLLQLSSGYWKSQTLFTAIELDIFTILQKGRLTAKEVARTIHTNERATEMLLNALVSLDLLTKKDESYDNSEIANIFLVRGKPQYQGDAIHHFQNIMENWTMMKQTVETGEAVVLKDLPERADPHDLRDFITAMQNIASVKAPELSRLIDLKDAKCLLDIAGGPGTYAIELVKSIPELRAVVFDLKDVVKLTHEFIQAAGMEEKVTTQAGNCLEDSFGKGLYDAILVSNLLHIYNPENNRKILAKCYEALKADGKIIIHEFILNENRTHPQFAALFSLNMLIGTQEGASYSESDYREWLENAGFSRIDKRELETNSTVIIARK